ncbi:MAG: MBL fold metallo-hydrolase [Candidatus Nitrosocosmicus sp.]|nr:MBL fold metallo-hydrolase [Candidatus Nitrosocosmicus sp.]MDN5867652.1 MBL fold metallo-hydrolase [Candidatus Nitrosocosmicus sp.]
MNTNIARYSFVAVAFIFLYTLFSNPAYSQVPNYDLQEIKPGVYVVSAGGYNSMFMVTQKGVVVVDAPPAIGDKIFAAVSNVTDKPITHLIYSHAHKDHIGAANIFENVTIIAHNKTAEILIDRNDTNRPVPDMVFFNEMNLPIGDQEIQLLYPGPYHQRGNIFVYMPEHKVLMAGDYVVPGGVLWKHLGVTPDVPTLIKSIDQALALDFDVFVGGHGQPGTKQDVIVQQEYVNDLQENAKAALNEVNRTEVIQGINGSNAITEAYFNALTKSCTDKTDAEWKSKLEGVGVWTDEHCERMIISERVT